MVANIVTIGDELLIGQVINTNASWIAEQLTKIGFTISHITTVGDNKSDIINVLRQVNIRSGLVLITGGLGPTSDDITKPALCEYFETDLRFDDNVFKYICEFLALRNITVNDLNRKQAEVPTSCKVIYNEIGTAPGIWLLKDTTIFIAMPGVPFEMKQMMEKRI